MDLLTYLDPVIMARLQTGGYVLMFALMVFEGPIVTFISAFLASLGVFDIWLVFLLGFLGDIVGDLIFYIFGYITGHHAKTKRFLHSHLLGSLQYTINKHLFRALIIIKFMPYLPPIGLSMVGAMHVNIWRYLMTTIGLSLVGPTIFGLSGYYIGFINTLLPKTTWGITLSCIITFLVLGALLLSYVQATKRLAKKTLQQKQN